MRNIIQATNKSKILLWFFILAYIVYFSYFSIIRYRTLYANYYDLGIMNQTVYNSYQAIKTGNFSRMLELTDTEKPIQIKRMAIHNDIILATLALFYFIHAGPETLLVLQTIVLALGALAIFGITKHVLSKYLLTHNTYHDIFGLVFAFAYLMYPPMQRANIFDFHPVTLATSFLLFMFYFWLKRQYIWSLVFFMLSLMTKENVGLTTAMFGIYVIISNFKFLISKQIPNSKTQILRKDIIYSLFIIIFSLLWVGLSFFVIIPYFRGSNHFAAGYYDIQNTFGFIFHQDTFRYFLFLLGPLVFLSVFSPLLFLISLPELTINLLSSDWNMRNIIFHYTSVIQPWVFVSAIYGASKISNIKYQISKTIILIIFAFSILFAYFKGPLPFCREQEVHPFLYPQKVAKDVELWVQKLADDSIKISTTGQEAPFFSSRQYLYLFSRRYALADYIVLRREEIYNYPEKKQLVPIHEKLVKDTRFQKIYDKDDLEVYKKVIK